MNTFIIQTDFISIRWYSVLILVGAILGIIYFENEGRRHELDKDFLFNIAFWTIIFGLLSARIYYVLFNFNLYKNDLLSIFRIWEGGLAIHGGIIGGVLTLAFYAKKYNFNFLRITDYAVPALFLAQAIGRWGNFFNSEAHGLATTVEHLQALHIPNFVIEGMNIGGIYYEPTFFYESIFCLIGFILLLIIKHFRYTKVGTLSAIYLMYYGILRFFIECQRTDALMLGGFKMAQLVSVGMIITGLIILITVSRKSRFEDLYNRVVDTTIRY